MKSVQVPDHSQELPFPPPMPGRRWWSWLALSIGLAVAAFLVAAVGGHLRSERRAEAEAKERRFWYEKGQRLAQGELRKGRLALATQGTMSGAPGEFDRKREELFGIGTRLIGSDTIQIKDHYYIEGYNSVMRPAIEVRFGSIVSATMNDVVLLAVERDRDAARVDHVPALDD